jgi:hypothetical protein
VNSLEFVGLLFLVEKFGAQLTFSILRWLTVKTSKAIHPYLFSWLSFGNHSSNDTKAPFSLFNPFF